MRAPRFEGDQEVTIPESNLTDAAKGSGNVPLLALDQQQFHGWLQIFCLNRSLWSRLVTDLF
jgi:hypothetical protein